MRTILDETDPDGLSLVHFLLVPLHEWMSAQGDPVSTSLWVGLHLSESCHDLSGIE